MGFRKAPPANPAAAPGRTSDGGAAERITAAVLLVMAALLAYLRFGFLERQQLGPVAPFDLRNPMLDARVGECVEVEDSSQPGQVTCAVVAEPGVVRRPAVGPDDLGPNYDQLRRMPPYLVCVLRFPPPGKEGCSSTPSAAGEEYLLFDLNGFGMPSRIHAELIEIKPVWKRWGGRAHYAYEVEMLRHGNMAGPWTFWTSEEAPVTGVIYREYSYARTGTRQVIYREVEGCTAPD